MVRYTLHVLLILLMFVIAFKVFQSLRPDINFNFLVKSNAMAHQKKFIQQAGFKYSDTGLIKKNKKNNTFQSIHLGWKRMEYRTNDDDQLTTIINQMKNRVVFDTQESYTLIGTDEERTFNSGTIIHEFPLAKNVTIRVLYDPETVKEEKLIIFITEK